MSLCNLWLKKSYFINTFPKQPNWIDWIRGFSLFATVQSQTCIVILCILLGFCVTYQHKIVHNCGVDAIVFTRKLWNVWCTFVFRNTFVKISAVNFSRIVSTVLCKIAEASEVKFYILPQILNWNKSGHSNIHFDIRPFCSIWGYSEVQRDKAEKVNLLYIYLTKHHIYKKKKNPKKRSLCWIFLLMSPVPLQTMAHNPKRKKNTQLKLIII